VIPDLKKLHDSYGIATSALRVFASTMASLQTRAALALSLAKAAAGEQQMAQGQLSTASAQLQAANDAVSEAGRQIAGAESTIEHQLQAANISAGVKVAVTGLLASLAGTGSSESTQVANQVASYLQAEPGGQAILPVVRAAVLAVGDAAQARISAQRAAERASAAMSAASRAAGDAADALARARATIRTIGDEFQDAARVAARTLATASAAGIQNASKLDRLINRVDTDVGAGVFAADKLVAELEAASHGNFTGLEQDARAVALRAAVLAHEGAAVVHEAAAQAARVTTELAPVFTVIGVAAKILTVVLPPPLDGVAAGIALGATLLPMLVTAEAEEAEVASDAVEVGSDEASLAMGAGSEAQLDSDAEAGVTDSLNLMESSTNDAIDLALPDAGDALGDVLPEATTLIPTVAEVTLTTTVSQTEGDLESAVESDADEQGNSLLPPGTRVASSVSSS
jgi:hypothetical protein